MSFYILSLFLLAPIAAADDTPQSSARVQVTARATIIRGEAVALNSNMDRPESPAWRSAQYPSLARSRSEQEKPGEPILILTEFH